MPLNYSSWVVFDGNKEGVLEVHHEFLRLVVDEEVTVIRLSQLTALWSKERDPQRDQLWLHTSDGEKIKLTIEDLGGFEAAIPRSFHVGW